MAYTTSTATTMDGLLEAVKDFALAQGWTIDTYEAITDGHWLHLHLGTAHFDLFTDNTPASPDYSPELILTGATGYDGGQDQLNQPGSRTDTIQVYCNDLSAGSYVKHHFFAGADFVHCVVEVSSGRFVHFGFGTLDKAGTYTGGEYVYGTRWYLNNASYSSDQYSAQHFYPFGPDGAHIRFTENDLSGADTYKDWATVKSYPASTTNYLRAMGFYNNSADTIENLLTIPLSRQPNYFNGLAVLLPINIVCGRTNNLTSVLGSPKEMRYINIQYLSASQELTLGADTWLIFPVKQKGLDDDTTTPLSGWYGLAYKKVV